MISRSCSNILRVASTRPVGDDNGTGGGGGGGVARASDGRSSIRALSIEGSNGGTIHIERGAGGEWHGDVGGAGDDG